MTTATFVRRTSSSLLIFSYLVVMMWMTACDDTVVNNSITYEGGSLTDPNIMPQVIFTSPAPNSVGPFEDIFNGGDGYYYPHFIIQFNKLVNNGVFVVMVFGDDLSLSGPISGAITIEGFDEPTVVRPFDYYGPEYSDIFAFSGIS